ncbi:MAG: hypothetical protein HY841_12010 [Bacteroidetes bacterium]|nr:hypothetical protein [Bacteroidota bacterium]
MEIKFSNNNMALKIFTFLLLLISLTIISCSANKIDSLTTDKDVFAFVQQFFPDFKGFDEYYNETIKISDSLKVRNWTKTDIDNNGETDLLVFRGNDLPNILTLLSFNGTYKKISAKYHCKYQFIYPIVKTIDNKKLLLLYSQEQTGYDPNTKHFTYTKLACETLTIKNNLFLNYIQSPRHYDIEKIEIKNDGICEGNCPRINISINLKTFENICSKQMYWDSTPKNFTGQLTQNEIKNILSLLDYSNFSDFNSKYEIGCTDQTTTTLIITYDNGKIKNIEDYGSSGNFTLAEIYDIVYNIKWIEKNE